MVGFSFQDNPLDLVSTYSLAFTHKMFGIFHRQSQYFSNPMLRIALLACFVYENFLALVSVEVYCKFSKDFAVSNLHYLP